MKNQLTERMQVRVHGERCLEYFNMTAAKRVCDEIVKSGLISLVAILVLCSKMNGNFKKY